MSKFGTIVMGPAGAGKTTFCTALIQHLQNTRRSCFYVNLDPAAEEFAYEPDVDIKDLISLSDVMEEMELGPNGGLIYCFEFLLDNLDFLAEELDKVTEEYLIILDLPGQIELYTHVPVVPKLVSFLTRGGAVNMNLCATYLLESTFVVDTAKFFAGTLSALSAMLMLEVPHLTVLSKMDLVKGQVSKKELRRFLQPDSSLLDDDDDDEKGGVGKAKAAAGAASKDPSSKENVMTGSSFSKLNKAVARLIEDYNQVAFLTLDVQSEESMGGIVSYIDDLIQYHEAQEPREPNDETEVPYED